MTTELQPTPSTQLGSGQMFDAIADRYDRLNRILSFGVDKGWRRKTVAALQLPADGDARVIDVATGTGDLAIDIARRHPGARVVGVDPSLKMLEIGRRKVEARGLAERVELFAGDAQALDHADASFDGATIAFGIRNVPDRKRGLAEMARVVRPGGRVCVLELGEPKKGVIAPLARFHVRVLVPRIGALLSGKREYRYLQQSIAAFPPPEAFAALMAEVGLEIERVVPLTFGTCHLYVGRVPTQPGARA